TVVHPVGDGGLVPALADGGRCTEVPHTVVRVSGDEDVVPSSPESRVEPPAESLTVVREWLAWQPDDPQRVALAARLLRLHADSYHLELRSFRGRAVAERQVQRLDNRGDMLSDEIHGPFAGFERRGGGQTAHELTLHRRLLPEVLGPSPTVAPD